MSTQYEAYSAGGAIGASDRVLATKAEVGPEPSGGAVLSGMLLGAIGLVLIFTGLAEEELLMTVGGFLSVGIGTIILLSQASGPND